MMDTKRSLIAVICCFSEQLLVSDRRSFILAIKSGSSWAALNELRDGIDVLNRVGADWKLKKVSGGGALENEEHQRERTTGLWSEYRE